MGSLRQSYASSEYSYAKDSSAAETQDGASSKSPSTLQKARDFFRAESAEETAARLAAESPEQKALRVLGNVKGNIKGPH